VLRILAMVHVALELESDALPDSGSNQRVEVVLSNLIQGPYERPHNDLGVSFAVRCDLTRPKA